MRDEQLRRAIHRAVDAYSPSAEAPPYLAQRIRALANEKEPVRMKKKLSAAAILLIVLLLLSITALAVGITLSVEGMWQQSFEKMNTTGEIRNLSDETAAEIPLEEAVEIARNAIIAKFGTPESELDAMGVYPTYAARGWDGKTDDYPSEWEVFFSSRTDVDLDLDHTDYGPAGEYLVTINAETREVDICIWYTNDFWSRAQVVWDCGSYDEVYRRYKQTAFYEQPIERQTYWRNLLEKQGYEVVSEDEKRHALLLRAATQLMFTPVDEIADNGLPQVAAAWEAIGEAYGLEAELLRKYAYVATVPAWETGSEEVCIHYSYELQWQWLDSGLIESHCNQLFNSADRLGLFMVSFAPGTTEVAAITHVTYSETGQVLTYESEGLLARLDWEAADLIALDEAYTEMVRAYERLEAAGATLMDKSIVKNAVMLSLGDNPAYRTSAPEGYDVRQWFTDEGEKKSPYKPTLSYDEVAAQYGESTVFWPLEAQYDLLRQHNLRLSLPREGEMTEAEATELALQAIREQHGQQALDKLGDYRVGVSFERCMGEHGKEITVWTFYIVDRPDWTMGWQVTFIGENYEDYGGRGVTVCDVLEVGVG